MFGERSEVVGNSAGLLLVLGSLALGVAVTFAVLTIVLMIMAAAAVQLSVRRVRSHC